MPGPFPIAWNDAVQRSADNDGVHARRGTFAIDLHSAVRESGDRVIRIRRPEFLFTFAGEAIHCCDLRPDFRN